MYQYIKRYSKGETQEEQQEAFRSGLSCTGFRALTVLSYQYCRPDSPVLAVLFYLLCSAYPVLAFSFLLHDSGCLVLAVLFKLSRSDCSFLAVLSFPPCPGCFILSDLS
jgi:hypothetical protein